MERKKSRYRHHGGKKWIEVRVRSAQQLFDARDPAPFRERDLDDDFVEYIVSAASEFSRSTPLKLVVYLEDQDSREVTTALVKEAIHDFFLYKTEILSSELKTFLKRGQIFLSVGILLLVACVSVAQAIGPSHSNTLIGILREGVVIFGWISLWKPMELLLFDWFPIFEKLRLFKKLQATEVDVYFGKAMAV